MTIDHHSFHEFERAGWERASLHYDEAFGALTAQTADALLGAARVGTGTSVLDVATGPGPIASAAAARGAHVIGIDFSQAMIAEARRRHPAIEFREGDAEALAFDAAAFDAVVMNFGLLHLARPEAAIGEAYRVLRPGGRYALTVWSVPEEAVGFGIALRAVQEHGDANVQLPEGPPFFRFSVEGECKSALERVGFTDVAIRTVPLIWRLSSADAVFEALSKGGVRTAAILRAQTPEALAAIRGVVRRAVETYARDGAFELPMPAVLASGVRLG